MSTYASSLDIENILSMLAFLGSNYVGLMVDQIEHQPISNQILLVTRP